jgi:predicted nucleic acid-binding protein
VQIKRQVVEPPLSGSHGLSIAAHSRFAGLTLARHNLRKFSRVPRLKAETWL